MSDDTPSRGGKDRTHIDVNDDHELRYWSRRLDVSRTDLKRAVAVVGTVAAEVARHFGKNLDKVGRKS